MRTIVRDRGHLPLGVQLELGAVAFPFEDRVLRDRGSGTIVRVRGADSGAHRGVPWIFPGLVPAPPVKSRAR